MARKSVGPEGAPLTLLRPSANVVGLDGADRTTPLTDKQTSPQRVSSVVWKATVGGKGVRFIDTGQAEPEFPQVPLSDILELIDSPPERHALVVRYLAQVGVTARAKIDDKLALLIPAPIALEFLAEAVAQERIPQRLVPAFDHNAMRACACAATRYEMPLTAFVAKAAEAYRVFRARVGAGGGE